MALAPNSIAAPGRASKPRWCAASWRPRAAQQGMSGQTQDCAARGAYSRARRAAARWSICQDAVAMLNPIIYRAQAPSMISRPGGTAQEGRERSACEAMGTA
jgi:hypothetical protein